MKNVKLVEMEKQKTTSNKIDLLERTVKFSRLVIRLYKELESNSIGKVLGQQLLRSATAVGANFHEAQGGQSKSDFISKLSIAQKEAIESSYWLRLIQEEEIVSGPLVKEAAEESKQLAKILSSILISSKQTI